MSPNDCIILDQADPVLTPQVAKLSDNYSRLEQLVRDLHFPFSSQFKLSILTNWFMVSFSTNTNFCPPCPSAVGCSLK